MLKQTETRIISNGSDTHSDLLDLRQASALAVFIPAEYDGATIDLLAAAQATDTPQPFSPALSKSITVDEWVNFTEDEIAAVMYGAFQSDANQTTTDTVLTVVIRRG